MNESRAMGFFITFCLVVLLTGWAGQTAADADSKLVRVYKPQKPEYGITLAMTSFWPAVILTSLGSPIIQMVREPLESTPG